MPNEEKELHSNGEEEEDEEVEEEEEYDDEVEDDQEIIYKHNMYLAEYLPGFIYAVKTCTTEAGVKVLDLANLGLEASHLRQFFSFLPKTQITELNLESNDLRWTMQQFAPQLTKSKVTKLSLESCTIQKSEVLMLMEALQNTQITDLDLSNFYDVDLMAQSAINFVSHLMKSRVTRLTLTSTSLMEHGGLPKYLAQYLPRMSITYLNLSHSMRGNAKALESLFTGLPKTSVTELHLGGNEITDDELKPLCQNLRQSKLEVLSLHFNKITDEGINMLSEALINSKVTNLGVCMNEIRGANNLGRHLKETNISILNLGWNKIESCEMFAFPNFLEGTSVTQLGLDRTHLDDERAQNLMKCLKSSKITELDLCGNKFGLPAVEEFAKVLKDTNITNVNISDNNLSAEAFQVLGEGLKGSKLQKLVARGNLKLESKDSAVAAFIDKTKNTTLDSLDFSETKFQNDAVKLLAASIMNTTFTHLDLVSCKIGAGVADLAPSLKHTAITHLDLSRNEIDDKGAEKLADCLKETQIIDLSIKDNSITDKGAKALVLCLKTSGLCHLNLESNKITDDGIEELAEMLEGTFVTNLEFNHNKGHRTLPLLTVLWRNRFLVHKLVNFFKLIAPATSDSPLCFDRSTEGDVSKFIERCVLFYKAVLEQPSAINVLAQEKSLALSRKQVAKLVLDEFPSLFASFVGGKTDVEVAQHVRILERAEECKLSKIVEHLLLNRAVLMIDKNLGILQPVVYKLLIKYGQPICISETEPEGKNKVIKYFTEHSDLAGALDVIEVLSN